MRIRVLLIGALLVALSGCRAVLPVVYAQSFPVTKTLFWSPVANADSYDIFFDGTKLFSVIASSSACTASECKTPLTIPTGGAHTAGVEAVAVFGSSGITTYGFSAVIPSKPTGVGIR